MILRHFRLDGLEANVFLVACERTRDALLVDAGEFTAAMAECIEESGFRLTQVFITHDHFDHADALPEIVDRYHPTVYAGKGAAGGSAAHKVGLGDTVAVGRLVGYVLPTPGHTPESICLAFPGHVFTGDALFAGSVGGTASPALARQQLEAIRRHLFSLPPDTEIHPGHGPASTVAIESRCNPFFV